MPAARSALLPTQLLPPLRVRQSNHAPSFQANRSNLPALTKTHPRSQCAPPPCMPSRSNHAHPPAAKLANSRVRSLGPNTPKNRQKCAPPRLKSFLEKTLTARETPTSSLRPAALLTGSCTQPKHVPAQPFSPPSASASLARWERVGVRVFRASRHRKPSAPQPTPASRTRHYPSLHPSSPPKIRQISRPARPETPYGFPAAPGVSTP